MTVSGETDAQNPVGCGEMQFIQRGRPPSC